MLPIILFAAIAFTAVLSFIAPVVLRPLLRTYGVLDVPNARSSHTVTVVRGLGIGVWIAQLAGMLLLLFCGFFGNSAAFALGSSFWQALVVISGFNLAAGLGLVEDFLGLSVATRSALQMLFAAVIVWGAALPVFGDIPFVFTALLLLFGLLFVSSFINVANFMDGLNGISALQGIVAGVVFAVIGGIEQQTWLIGSGAILAVAFTGFLVWNLAGKGFLGDVGSYLLGGSVITISFASLCSGVQPLAAIGPTVVYFGDVGWTLIKRVRRGEKWFEAHKEHCYQRLQQAGFSHGKTAILLAAHTLFASLLGILVYLFPTSIVWQVVLLLAGFAVVVLYLNLPRLLRHARVA